MSDIVNKSWDGRLSDGLRDRIEVELRRLGLVAERKVMDEIDAQGLSAFGDLRASQTHSVSADPGAMTLSFGPSAAHAPYRFYGLDPGTWPPPEPLAAWAEIKLGVGSDESDSVAFLIGRKIFRQGTEGADFLSDPSAEVEDEATERLEAVITKHLRR